MCIFTSSTVVWVIKSSLNQQGSSSWSACILLGNIGGVCNGFCNENTQASIIAVILAGVIVMSCMLILIWKSQRDTIYIKWRIFNVQKSNWRHIALWKQITNYYMLLNQFCTFCSSFNYQELLSISHFYILKRASVVWESKGNILNTFKSY